MSKNVPLRPDIPLLSIVYSAAGGFPVTVEIHNDWKQTGEYTVFCQSVKRGYMAAEVLQFASNALADELWNMVSKGDLQNDPDEGEAPF